MRRRCSGCWPAGVRVLFAAAGLACCGAAPVVWQSYARIAAVPLAADEQWSPALALPSPGRYRYRVYLRGTLHAPQPGISIDGRVAWNRQGDEWPHGALELQPGTLAVQPAAGRRGELAFVPEAGAAIEGPVTARLDLSDFHRDLYLPAGTELGPLEGRLELEVRRRDPRSQNLLAGLILTAGLMLIGVALRASSETRRAR